MYREAYKATVRSEWSEFSLRARPSPITPFQAGLDEPCVSVKGGNDSDKGDHSVSRYALRNKDKPEDSIENDAYTILMSYPEGQQRLLERMTLEEQLANQKQRESNQKVEPDTTSYHKTNRTKTSHQMVKATHTRPHQMTEISKHTTHSKNALTKMTKTSKNRTSMSSIATGSKKRGRRRQLCLKELLSGYKPDASRKVQSWMKSNGLMEQTDTDIDADSNEMVASDSEVSMNEESMEDVTDSVLELSTNCSTSVNSETASSANSSEDLGSAICVVSPGVSSVDSRVSTENLGSEICVVATKVTSVVSRVSSEMGSEGKKMDTIDIVGDCNEMSDMDPEAVCVDVCTIDPIDNMNTKSIMSKDVNESDLSRVHTKPSNGNGPELKPGCSSKRQNDHVKSELKTICPSKRQKDHLKSELKTICPSKRQKDHLKSELKTICRSKGQNDNVKSQLKCGLATEQFDDITSGRKIIAEADSTTNGDITLVKESVNLEATFFEDSTRHGDMTLVKGPLNGEENSIGNSIDDKVKVFTNDLLNPDNIGCGPLGFMDVDQNLNHQTASYPNIEEEDMFNISFLELLNIEPEEAINDEIIHAPQDMVTEVEMSETDLFNIKQSTGVIEDDMVTEVEMSETELLKIKQPEECMNDENRHAPQDIVTEAAMKETEVLKIKQPEGTMSDENRHAPQDMVAEVEMKEAELLKIKQPEVENRHLPQDMVAEVEMSETELLKIKQPEECMNDENRHAPQYIVTEAEMKETEVFKIKQPEVENRHAPQHMVAEVEMKETELLKIKQPEECMNHENRHLPQDMVAEVEMSETELLNIEKPEVENRHLPQDMVTEVEMSETELLKIKQPEVENRHAPQDMVTEVEMKETELLKIKQPEVENRHAPQDMVTEVEMSETELLKIKQPEVENRHAPQDMVTEVEMNETELLKIKQPEVENRHAPQDMVTEVEMNETELLKIKQPEECMNDENRHAPQDMVAEVEMKETEVLKIKQPEVENRHAPQDMVIEVVMSETEHMKIKQPEECMNNENDMVAEAALNENRTLGEAIEDENRSRHPAQDMAPKSEISEMEVSNVDPVGGIEDWSEHSPQDKATVAEVSVSQVSEAHLGHLNNKYTEYGDNDDVGADGVKVSVSQVSEGNLDDLNHEDSKDGVDNDVDMDDVQVNVSQVKGHLGNLNHEDSEDGIDDDVGADDVKVSEGYLGDLNQENSEDTVDNIDVGADDIAVVEHWDGDLADTDGYFDEDGFDGVDEDDPNSESMFGVGTLIWAKYSKTIWWPAIIIRGPMAGQQEARDGCTWIMWFGDYKISQMRWSQIDMFTSEFKQKCCVKMSSLLECAVVETLQECAERVGIDVGDYDAVKSWGLHTTRFTDLVEAAAAVEAQVFAPEPGMELPTTVVQELEKLREENLAALSDTDNEELASGEACVCCMKPGRQLLCDHPLFEFSICSRCKDVLMETMFAFDSDGFNLFCVVCGQSGEMFVCEDRSCGRCFCARCLKQHLGEEDFEMVSEQTPWLCLLCSMYSDGTHGSLIPRSDWQLHLVKFFNPVQEEVGESIPANSDTCLDNFVHACNKEDNSGNGDTSTKGDNPTEGKNLFKGDNPESGDGFRKGSNFGNGDNLVEGKNYIKDDNQLNEDNILKLNNSSKGDNLLIEDETCEKRRKLRVLSLCDGIGSARLALEALGVDIGAYYSCETDEGVQYVAQFSHGDNVTCLGDVYAVTTELVKEMCPVDLVICSPPCEDLDVTSTTPDTGGFNGSGMIIVKFLMILKELTLLQDNDRPFFWLLETSATLKTDIRTLISNFLESSPCMWDPVWFSPYHRPSLFWGNLPHLYSACSYFKTHRDEQFDLDSCLVANLNRNAKTSQLRSCAICFKIETKPTDTEDGVTTVTKETTEIQQSHSNAPASELNFVLPVDVKGCPTNIWTVEVERVLGLPDHYTDVSRISVLQRQQFLKQASSVRLLKHLLSPMADRFITK